MNTKDYLLRPEIHEAVEKTFRAYERLISDPEGEYKKWEYYGNLENCRLCMTVGKNQDVIPPIDCYDCPFQNVVKSNYFSIVGCYTVKAERLGIILRFFYKKRRIMNTAKARFQELKDHIEYHFGWRWNGKKLI